MGDSCQLDPLEHRLCLRGTGRLKNARSGLDQAFGKDRCGLQTNQRFHHRAKAAAIIAMTTKPTMTSTRFAYLVDMPGPIYASSFLMVFIKGNNHCNHPKNVLLFLLCLYFITVVKVNQPAI